MNKISLNTSVVQRDGACTRYIGLGYFIIFTVYSHGFAPALDLFESVKTFGFRLNKLEFYRCMLELEEHKQVRKAVHRIKVPGKRTQILRGYEPNTLTPMSKFSDQIQRRLGKDVLDPAIIKDLQPLSLP